MEWFARSPDHKPVGHILDQTGLFIRDMDNHPTTVAQLRETLLYAWDAVTPEMMEVLMQSMSQRLWAVVAVRGGHTRY